MSLNIKYRFSNGLGIFHVSGEKDFTNAKLVWKRIHQSIADENTSAVIIYDELIDRLSVVQVLDIEKWLNHIGFPKSKKVAIVDANADGKSLNRFGEDVAVNRGWYNIRVFSSESNAQEWLNLSIKGENMRP